MGPKPIGGDIRRRQAAAGIERRRAAALRDNLIENAKANGLDPYSYLRPLFERLPATRTQEQTRALLPWNVDRSQLLRPHRATHESPR